MKAKITIVLNALLAAVVAQGIGLPELPVRDDADVMGYVHDGTRGVAGVLVSDGYDFSCTDENGAYYLSANPAALMVYAVLPSGYEFSTVSDGVPAFFKALNRGGEVTRADFALNPIGDDDSFSFLVHADTQPEPYFNMQVYSDMGKAYMEMARQAAVIAGDEGFMPFNLHLGDIVYNNNSAKGYGAYFSCLADAGYNVPTFATPGNHDRLYILDYEKSLELYRGSWGPERYSFNRGKVHFISLDNVAINKEDAFGRGIRPEALEWLKKDLSYVEKGSRVVFFTHRPMTQNASALNAYSAALDVLKDYEVLILSGHVHRSFTNYEEYAPSIRERSQVPLGGFIWRGPCTQDGVPQGYYIYHVDGTDISWKFKWLGKDADKNLFRVYEPGQFDSMTFDPDEDKTVIANVWDWDEHWTVTWSLDGVPQGEVPRYEGFRDPWAVYNYDGREEFPEWSPSETYHMFHCDVPATGSVVEINVTDRFGREASKTVTLESVSGGIESVSSGNCGITNAEIYNAQGVKVLTVAGYPEADMLPIGSGCYIMRLHHTDGTVTIEKVIR